MKTLIPHEEGFFSPFFLNTCFCYIEGQNSKYWNYAYSKVEVENVRVYIIIVL